MNLRTSVLLACSLAACQSLDPGDGSQSPTHPGGKADGIDSTKAQVRGTIVNAATGEGIPNARVVMIGNDAEFHADATGTFLMPNVEPGPQTLFAITGQPHCSLFIGPLQADLGVGENEVELTLAAPPSTLLRKVLVINYDPILEDFGGERLNAHRGWNDPRTLMDDTFRTIGNCSGNYLHYQVVDWVDVDAIPTLEDGHVYSDQEYLDVLNGVQPHHEPSMADPHRMLEDFDVLARIDSGEIDEVVMWGGPYMGFYESRMIGPSAYWVNGPQVDTASARNFVLMGLNPERGVAEALHSYGHRIENNLRQELGNGHWSPHDPKSKWDRFSTFEIMQPGNSGCGTIHHPPNAEQDYDYGNLREVSSRCGEYHAWPNAAPDAVEIVSGNTWGLDDSHRRYLEWWMVHIPKFEGTDSDGDFNNWWKYIADFDR